MVRPHSRERAHPTSEKEIQGKTKLQRRATEQDMVCPHLHASTTVKTLCLWRNYTFQSGAPARRFGAPARFPIGKIQFQA